MITIRPGHLLVAVAAFGIVGCEEKRMPPEEVLSQAKTLEDPGPGLYETTTELVAFEVTGAPPAVADRLRTQMGGVGKSTGQRCITEEEESKGFDAFLEELVEGVNSMDCGFSRFEASAPQFNAKLTCDGPMDAEASVAFAGETSSTGYDMSMDTEASSRIIAGGSMEMRMKFTAKRIGECESDPAASIEVAPEE